MHEQFANGFYGTEAWKQCRADYANAHGGLCDRCLAKGIINAGSKDNPLEVHHKIRLTPENINDPSVTLNWDNLELLCKQCHREEHERDRQARMQRRYTVDVYGHVELR